MVISIRPAWRPDPDPSPGATSRPRSVARVCAPRRQGTTCRRTRPRSTSRTRSTPRAGSRSRSGCGRSSASAPAPVSAPWPHDKTRHGATRRRFRVRGRAARGADVARADGEPRAAAGEVVVAVKSAAVGWVDVLMTSGQYQHVPEPPYTPGSSTRASWWRARASRRARRCSWIRSSPGRARTARIAPTVASRRTRSRPRGGDPDPRRAVDGSGVQPARQLRDRVPLPRRARPARRPARRCSSTAHRARRGWPPCTSRSCSARP